VLLVPILPNALTACNSMHIVQLLNVMQMQAASCYLLLPTPPAMRAFALLLPLLLLHPPSASFCTLTWCVEFASDPDRHLCANWPCSNVCSTNINDCGIVVCFESISEWPLSHSHSATTYSLPSIQLLQCGEGGVCSQRL
jgi:hypothetical protein